MPFPGRAPVPRTTQRRASTRKARPILGTHHKLQGNSALGRRATETAPMACRAHCSVSTGAAVTCARAGRRSPLSWTNLSSRPAARRTILLAAAFHACGRLRTWAATLARAHQQASRNRNRRRKQLLLPRRREQSGARWRAAGSINRCALLTADSEASERFAATARHRRAYCRRPKASRCLPPTLTPDKPRSPVRKVRRPVPAPSPAAPRCVHSAATDAASAVVIAVGLSVLVALDFALATFHSSKIYES